MHCKCLFSKPIIDILIKIDMNGKNVNGFVFKQCKKAIECLKSHVQIMN